MVASISRRQVVAGLAASFATVASPTWAGEIRVANIIAGAGMIRKPIVSMRERKFLNLIPQETDFSCGAASIATILTFAYGQPTTEEKTLVEMLKISDREKVLTLGFSLLDMKSYVETIGFTGEGFKIKPDNLFDIQVPVIALIDLDGYKHFVIIKNVTGEKVYVGDTALGNYILKFDEFLNVWQNSIVFAIIGDNYDQETILRKPAEPLSAKRLLAQHVPFISANILDFGISYADFF